MDVRALKSTGFTASVSYISAAVDMIGMPHEKSGSAFNVVPGYNWGYDFANMAETVYPSMDTTYSSTRNRIPHFDFFASLH